MCDIDKDVCRPPKSNFCRNLLIAAMAALIGMALSFKGLSLTSLFEAKNVTKKEVNETEKEEPMPYMAGVGQADMTGPIVDIAFMGYADMKQMGEGIHTRQWARAFIIDNNTTRVVIVSAEIHVVGIALRREVVRNLQKIYSEAEYNLTNVIIAATHTYSTPGGFLGDYLLDVSVLGFSNEVFYAYCDGITKAIVRAHTSIEPARLFYAHTRVWNVHINRSPIAYYTNPKIERNRFDMNTDNQMSQIRIMKRDNVLMGCLSFFAINANNLPITNKLVSSDNLGYAALEMEKALNPGITFHGTGKVIGAFFVGSAGDVSPNIRGARCQDNKKECNRRWKTCNKDVYCEPMGPADNPRDSAKIIGSGIYEAAMRVLVSPDAVEMSPGEDPGIMSVAYQYILPANETGYKYEPTTKDYNESHSIRGCTPAFGAAYTIGGLDGQPQLTLKEDYLTGNKLLDAMRSGLMDLQTTEDDHTCHDPKVLWLVTGRANFPVPWHQTSSVIVMNFGGEEGIYVASVPGEVSTMAGRRIKQVIKTETKAEFEKIVIMGLTNEYIHHITTSDEYEVQEAEGGATLYGPNTLDVYLNKYTELAKVAKTPDGKVEDLGPQPSYFKDQAVSLVIPASYDQQWQYTTKDIFQNEYYWNRPWGYVVSEPDPSVPTEKTIKCHFMAANPRNDLFTGMTHMTVDKWETNLDDWVVVLSDADWDTRLEWYVTREKFISRAIVYWDVPATARYSYYRFHYYGAAKSASTGRLYYFEAKSRSFYVNYKYNRK